MKKRKVSKYLLDKYFLDKYNVKVLWKDEHTLNKWFLRNYRKLGFSKIKKTEEGPKDPGDYIGLRNGRWLRIELETETSGFFLHKAEIRDAIPIIICLKKNFHREDWKNDEMETKEIFEIESLLNLEDTIVLSWWAEKIFLDRELKEVFGEEK